jgi:signal transduction histidine kinase
LLDSFASAAASALAVSSALEREMRELAIASSEAERRRWARELHDETLQELAALKVIAESSLRSGDATSQGRALERVTGQIEQVIGGVESLITELRPAALDDLGTQAAIEALLDRVRERSGLAIEADFDLAWEGGRVTSRHQPEVEATIYRVVQEAVNNVVKHADASRARIAVTETNGTVSITVEDDGTGISARSGERSGFGLLGIRERLSLVGGEMSIGPGPGGGTRLSARLPARR